MGVVLRAHDLELDRPVALKLLRRIDRDPAARDRLRSEARALARLNHANVCQVYDVGEDAGEVYVAMELIDGQTLRGYLASAPASAAILDVLLCAGRGLAAAHAAGVVHRDVKPDNILVGRDGRVVVADFGLAAAAAIDAGPALPRTTRAIGTLGYAAPEQLLGTPVDARADQFGWCATAWEALTGQPPFTAQTIGEQILAIGRGPTSRPPAGRAIAGALLRGLASDPADRFGSMAALLAAVAPKRSRRLGVIAAAALAVAVVAVLAIRPWRSEAVATRVEPTRDAAVATMTNDAAAADAGQADATEVAQADAPPRAPARSPTPATPPSPRTPMSAGALDAAVATWCHLPVDPRHPDPALAAWHRADWGVVERVERAAIVDSFTGLRVEVELFEIRGQAARRRVIRWTGEPVAVGALAIVCDNAAPTDEVIGQLPPAWRTELRTVSLLVAIASPPRITAKARFDPIHVKAAELDAAARAAHWHITTTHPVVARITVGADLGNGRFAVGDHDRGWIVEVPADTPGGKAFAPGSIAWAILDRPRIESGRLVLTLLDAEPRYVSPP
jgi:hypothetical protein